MANSGTVTAGSAALASQYNNLRDDVLNVSTGHTHTGASENGAKVAATGVSSGTAALNAVLTADGSGGASFLALAASGADVQEFTSSGSWVKPSGKSAVYVFAIGGGGGGASGARHTSGAYGGLGGGGAAHAARWFKASDLAGTVTVTIASGGAGATAAASGSTSENGIAGSNGGDTSFGTVALANGGPGGAFNTTGAATTGRGIAEYGVRADLNSSDAGGSAIRTSDSAGTAQTFDSNTSSNYASVLYPGRGSGHFFSAVRSMSRSGGGAAGGYSDGSGALVGGAGARGFGWNGNVANGGTAAGGAGSTADGIGGGGGGGGGVTNGTAGAGGAGYLGGGGGGGGGALRTAGNVQGGAGGAGGAGYVLVVSV